MQSGQNDNGELPDQPASPFEAAVYYFSRMDIDMLDLVLNQETYEDARKEVFLEKINGAFEFFRENGDTELIPLPGQCAHKECINYCKGGFAFAGNNSDYHIDLIFEGEGGELQDIYICYCFLPDNGHKFEGTFFCFAIHDEERVDFDPDPRYWHVLQRTNQAIAELMKFNETGLSEDDAVYWVERYHMLYEETEEFGKYVSLEGFLNYFNSLKEYLSFLPYREEAAEAMRIFHTYSEPHNDPGALIDWLMLFEELGLDRLDQQLGEHDMTTEGLFPLAGCFDILLSSEMAGSLHEFCRVFNAYYWDALLQVSGLSEKDWEIIYNTAESGKHKFSLRYFVERRAQRKGEGKV
jgi:hypothetical protein